MVGQVGGRSVNKRPVLTLASEYVLKPVTTDHRGIREIAFYEALETVGAQNRSTQAYSSFLTGKEEERKSGAVRWPSCWELMDTLAMALAIMVKDPFVQKSEADLREAWKAVKREVEALHQLSKFVPRCHGVVGQRGVSAAMDAPFGVTDDAYLLLQGLTSTYARPCVMDLKMGTCTFEPDASEAKQRREASKYCKQEEFGFRIIGMRVYDPSHPESDERGYRLFGKTYGRSLEQRENLIEAMRCFFSASCDRLSGTDNGGTDPGVRTRVISNVLLQLRGLRRWFDENKSLQFRASSLLLIYEGDPERGNGDVSLLKMIDFGHVRRVVGGDSGYLFGLRTLRHILTEILEQEEKAQGRN